MTLRWKGEKELNKRLRGLAKAMPKAAARGLYRGALLIMRRSKKVVPVDTNRLRASGFVETPEYNDRGARVQLGYGTEYAAFVHEGTSRMEGRAYLSEPMAESVPEVIAEIEKAIRKAMGEA